MLMDFDPDVVAVSSQPFWLHWRDGAGRSRRHAPDLFARMADGCGIVVDVRPDDRIEEKDAEAFEVTRGACTLAGWGFRRAGVPDPQADGGDPGRRRRGCGRRAVVTGRPGGLGIGDRIRFGGRDQVVIGISGTAVRLADAGGEVVTATVSGLLADGDFAVLDARPRPGVPQVSVLDGLPAEAVEEARWWERHIVEVLTGVPLDAGEGTVPRPEYDPGSPRSWARKRTGPETPASPKKTDWSR